MIDLRDFDFQLPPEQIAKHPISQRDNSRLLAVDRQTETRRHLHFHELGSLLRATDVLVVNKTKVLKARLYASDPSGRILEILLLSPLNANHTRWNCLVKPGRRVPAEGARLGLPSDWVADVQHAGENAFEIQFPNVTATEFHTWLELHGAVPLPPYMKRPAEPQDSEQYQTIFASEQGAVAAPTAGLHFTHGLVETLKSQGIQFEEVTLHVGYGTFAHLDPDATELHAEYYCVSPETHQRLAVAREQGRRVIAVGTTSLRALESTGGGHLNGLTRLFIRPGYPFTQIDGLITNFHVPRSSLFILVCALMGRERALSVYEEAVQNGYRFFSYGDAMAIL